MNLYAATLICWTSTILAISLGAVPEFLVVLFIVPFLLWSFHLSIFLSKTDVPKTVFSDMLKLLPYYMAGVVMFLGALLYPIVYISRSWVYETLGEKTRILIMTHGFDLTNLRHSPFKSFKKAEEGLKSLTFTKRERVAMVLHWFFEDEEELAGLHHGVYNNKDWVVDLVLPDKAIGTNFSRWETFLVNLYWEGNRNICANFSCEVLGKIGKPSDFKIVTDTKTNVNVSTPGIGIRRMGYSHTKENIGGVEHPTFTYMTNRLFITAGFGSSKVRQNSGYANRFYINNRILNND